ncbi:toxin [Thermoactinomyces sp. DSM 45891]|uniref:hypothetical protein n=1 Tax=Thermoactinomyces sp. DSM 45891 TaxID=1761907 RepID=UPI0009185D3D|nr:hypothetical protein [Thermoactinomyces sp. DSM 45891]SFX52113.1 toxin [Thermoactinomyces sp. DSM 45891]
MKYPRQRIYTISSISKGDGTILRTPRIQEEVPYEYKNLMGVELAKLQQALIQASKFNRAINPLSHSLSLSKANDIARRNRMMVVDKKETTLIKSKIEVGKMVNHIFHFLKKFIGNSLNKGLFNELSFSIQKIFTDLYLEESSNWIFWKAKSARSTTYIYNMLLAIQELDSNHLIIVPMSYEVHVNTSMEQVLNLTYKDIHDFEVKISILKVYSVL